MNHHTPPGSSTADTQSAGANDKTHLSETTKSQAVTAPGQSVRATVLPRVEWVGPEPKVNPSQRHRFEELGLLGEGGMGEVVLAKDHDIDREVALKRLPANCDLGRVLRFVEEIRTIGRLEHPNIVPVHDVGVDASGRYFFVMKRVQGETLESIIAKIHAKDPVTLERYPMERRVLIFLKILDAMAYAHEQGFIHRDLKPANVMIGPFGEVTVMDWGLARRVKGVEVGGTDAAISGPRDGTVLETRFGALLGTPLYMSPEQAEGKNAELDERSDVYALCVLFHEFLHGHHYLDGRQGLDAVLEGVKTVKPNVHTMRAPDDVPVDLDWFLDTGLSKAKADRWPSVRAMEDELQRIMRGECRVRCPRSLARRMLNETRTALDKHPVATMTSVVVMLAIGTTAVVHSLAVMIMR
ncbi:MAG: serine/threonine-protein kinase [Myxococcaceae bacterium]